MSTQWFRITVNFVINSNDAFLDLYVRSGDCTFENDTYNGTVNAVYEIFDGVCDFF